MLPEMPEFGAMSDRRILKSFVAAGIVCLFLAAVWAVGWNSWGTRTGDVGVSVPDYAKAQLDDGKRPAANAVASSANGVRPASIKPSPSVHPARSFAQRSGSTFGPVPPHPASAPEVVEIWVPRVTNGDAIWGATGRDDDGKIWYAVSAADVGRRSAQLFELDPSSSESHDRGNALEQLQSTQFGTAAIDQAEIRTRIIQADDGHLYFASMESTDEGQLGRELPTEPSHLWRLRRPDNLWEHVHAVPERLVSLAGVGRWMYALGDVGQVLYQYDVQTGQVHSVRVGSIEAHVTSRILTDERGHAFVPRPVRDTASGDVTVELIEFDEKLIEVGKTHLEHYLDGRPATSRGIVATVYLADRSIVFATQFGYLYRITAQPDGPAIVDALGWLHPKGRAEVAGLFTYSGQKYVVGAGRHADGDYEWLVFDLTSNGGQATRFTLADLISPSVLDFHLFGSITQDDRNCFYLAGRFRREQGWQPLLLRVHGQSSQSPAFGLKRSKRAEEQLVRDAVAQQFEPTPIPDPDPEPKPIRSNLIDPAKLVYLGASILPNARYEETYRRTDGSRAEITSHGAGVIQTEAHVYAPYTRKFKLSETLTMSMPSPKQPNHPATGTALDAWEDPFDGTYKALLQQTYDDAADPQQKKKTQRHLGFAVGGLASLYDHYQVSGRNVSCFYVMGSKNPMIRVTGKYSKSYRCYESGEVGPDGVLFVGAGEYANRDLQSQGPSIFEITNIGETVEVKPLVYHDHDHPFHEHHASTRWTDIGVGRGTMLACGWQPEGANEHAINHEIAHTKDADRIAKLRAITARWRAEKKLRWGYGKPPPEACTSSKGFWWIKATNRVAFYDLAELRAAAEPWDVAPYGILDVTDALWRGDCGQVGGVAWDEGLKRLYVCQSARNTCLGVEVAPGFSVI